MRACLDERKERGGALKAQVSKNVLREEQAGLIVHYIESGVRSVPAGSKEMDPDANRHCDFWNNRCFEEKKLG